jgi:hypothetical protein
MQVERAKGVCSSPAKESAGLNSLWSGFKIRTSAETPLFCLSFGIHLSLLFDAASDIVSMYSRWLHDYNHLLLRVSGLSSLGILRQSIMFLHFTYKYSSWAPFGSTFSHHRTCMSIICSRSKMDKALPFFKPKLALDHYGGTPAFDYI